MQNAEFGHQSILAETRAESTISTSCSPNRGVGLLARPSSDEPAVDLREVNHLELLA